MRGKILLVLIACTCIITLAHGAVQSLEAAEETMKLSFSSQFTPYHGVSKATVLWAQEIEKRTKGRVKILIYYSGTLTSAPACYEGVVRGLSDMGEALPAMTRGRFPLMEAVDLPGYPFNAVITSRAADDFYRKFKPKELDETHVLYMHAHAPGGMFFRTKPVKSLEDLKGLRIRCTGTSAKIVQALGATPVAMSKGEQYDAMSRGTVDGTVAPPNELLIWKVAEVAKYFDVYPKAGYVTTFAVVMNKAKWNSLPPDIQKVFTETSEAMPEKIGKAWNDVEMEGIKYGKKVGHKFIFITPEEGARWDNALKPLLDDYLKNTKAKNLPGEQALAFRRELIEKYSKMYAPLKFE
jgi:TRAP-type C4-dicarboxylate transport system substrate-binding protein